MIDPEWIIASWSAIWAQRTHEVPINGRFWFGVGLRRKEPKMENRRIDEEEVIDARIEAESRGDMSNADADEDNSSVDSELDVRISKKPAGGGAEATGG